MTSNAIQSPAKLVTAIPKLFCVGILPFDGEHAKTDSPIREIVSHQARRFRTVRRDSAEQAWTIVGQLRFVEYFGRFPFDGTEARIQNVVYVSRGDGDRISCDRVPVGKVYEGLSFIL